MTNCYMCLHALFIDGFEQPIGCWITEKKFSQEEPQPTNCGIYKEKPVIMKEVETVEPKATAFWYCNFVTKRGKKCRCKLPEYHEEGGFKSAYEKAKAHAERHGEKGASRCFERIGVVLTKQAGA